MRSSFRFPEPVRRVAVSPDGTRVASGAADGTIRVWRMADWNQVSQLSLPGQVQGLVWLDDSTLAATPQRGGIYVLTLDRARLLALVRGGVARGFTAEECTRFGLEPCPTLDQIRAGPGARLSGAGVP